MDASTIEWLVTLLATHLLAFAGVIFLYRGAPCWMQKVAMGLLIGAYAVFCLAYIAALSRVENWHHILLLAFALEHIAVMVYVFRVWWQGSHGNPHRAVAEVR